MHRVEMFLNCNQKRKWCRSYLNLAKIEKQLCPGKITANQRLNVLSNKTAINAPTINQIPGFNRSKISATAVAYLPPYQRCLITFAYNQPYAHYETVNSVEANQVSK